MGGASRRLAADWRFFRPKQYIFKRFGGIYVFNRAQVIPGVNDDGVTAGQTRQIQSSVPAKILNHGAIRIAQ